MAGAVNAIEEIGRVGLVAVVTVESADYAQPLADALFAAGLRCVEVVFRTPAAAAALERLAADGRLCVGAGTLLSPEQVDRAVAAGACFAVSPGLDEAVVRRCQAVGVTPIPGIATPTEAMAALRCGLDVVKLFPARVVGGLEMVKALAAPFPSLRFIPTGGIGLAELPAFAEHPSVLAVGGSWMTPGALLRTGRFDEVTRLAAEALTAVAAAHASATATSA